MQQGQSHVAAMLDWLKHEWDFHMWTVIAITAALTAAISIWADWRRNNRRAVGQISYMPWTSISLLSVGIALLAAALAIKSG
jgi:hypothetical protein